jgi:phosphate-selective porin OprO/OprP
MKWISTASLVMALGCVWTASQAMAQPGTAAQSFDELSARIEQQDRQIRQLQAQMSGVQQQGVNATPVAFAPDGTPAVTSPAPAAPQCAEVGSDMNIKARFWNGTGLMFETPNKDFTMHVGMWVQWDNVSWSQNSLNSAATAGNIGVLNDGDYWRRIRPLVEGTFFETFDYRFNVALENNQFSQAGWDEAWVGVNKLPVIGTIRAGHVKTPMGLEGDMTSSSRCMTFMERSSYSEAIELNQNFGSGLWFGNTYLDERGTWSAMVFRPDTVNGASGDYFGTGQWGAQARITGLPLYEDEGRHLLHLGLSGGWRNGTNVANGSGTPDYVSLGARPELRDDDPAGSPSQVAGGQAQYLPEANSTKMLSTGNIYCNQEFLLGTELLYIRGPFSLQGEYGWNFLNNAQLTATGTGFGMHPTGPIQNYVFNGGYVQAAYTLTGETRGYDKKYGGLTRYYFGSQGPYENAFLVRDADGNLCSGWGAWEVAGRFSYIDLNSGFGKVGQGTGGSYVNGGAMQGTSLALNWYLNTNLTIMTDWVYDYRYDMPNSKAAGSTNGIGTEVQLSF